MREDMSKVIVERPRQGGHGKHGRPLPVDQLPARQGMRRGYGSKKRLNENLAPLKRYLAAQVGRPWDKVYSEIAAHLRADNTVQQHVRDHLRDVVATRPRRGVEARWYRRDLPPGIWFQPLYVDPRDGILKRTDRLPEVKALRRAPAPVRERIRVPLGPDRELRRIRGLWFEVRIAPLPRAEYELVAVTRQVKRQGRMVDISVRIRRLVTAPVYDAVAGRWIPVGPEVDDYRGRAEFLARNPDGVYAIGKRTLSRAELRRHDLVNLDEEA